MDYNIGWDRWISPDLAAVLCTGDRHDFTNCLNNENMRNLEYSLWKAYPLPPVGPPGGLRGTGGLGRWGQLSVR